MVSSPHRPRPARGTSTERARRQAGQSSLEYTGILAVLTTVLALAALVTGAGGIANAVGRGLARALCVVGGGDCYATELGACTVRASQTSGRLGVKLTFLELGGRMSLQRQEMSDGTVDITLVDGAEAAPTAAVGAAGGVRIGAHGASTGAIASAELLVRLGRKQVWHVADGRAADRLTDQVERHVALRLARHLPGIGAPVRALAHLVGVDEPALPPADEVGFLAGARAAVEAKLPGGATVVAGLEASLGGSSSRVTGRTTVVLGLDGDASGSLAAAVGGATLTGSGGASVAVTFDRAGAPLDLAVSVAGTQRPGVSGGMAVGSRHRGNGEGLTRVERTAHLDLTQPENRAAYAALVAALGHPRQGASGPALAGLAGRLGVSARQDIVRTASRSATYGAGGEVALGARVGVGAEVTRTSMVLEDAWTRPAGGVWERRTDCLGDRRRA